jgi:uncharacterized protein (DUF885 family)
MPRRSAVLLLLVVASSCASGPPTAKQESADSRFETLAKDYFEQALSMSPEFATELGDHRFDTRTTDYSDAAEAQDRALVQSTLNKLQQIPLADLSRTNQIDARILQHRLSYMLFRADVLREREWNPLHYHFGQGIYVLIARDFAPLGERLQSVKARLEALPTAITQAKSNLKAPPPKVHTETAISQNKGTIRMVREELSGLAAQVPGMTSQLQPAQERALAALEDYGRWLESDLLARSTGDFRLGEVKYREKLRFTLESDLSIEEIQRTARADLATTQEQIYQVALPLYRQYFPQKSVPSQVNNRKQVVAEVLTKLAERRPTNDTIVTLASASLKSTTEFVQSKDLVSVPGEPVKVVVMPEFKRGVSVAYCEPSGALEKHGESFVAISPTPSDWPRPRVESFFKEYNDYMVQNLTVHEAMPGHYLQLVHSNHFEAPTPIRAVFRSGLFAEGWAVYAERVMADHGYGGPEVRMQQLKMRLRMILNAILDGQIHAGTMTEKQAIALMRDEGFQEEGEAAGKWRRAQLTSAQLPTYYVGNLEIEAIARDYAAKHGAQSTERQMHDAMLSFGTPAPKYVRELLGL